MSDIFSGEGGQEGNLISFIIPFVLWIGLFLIVLFGRNKFKKNKKLDVAFTYGLVTLGVLSEVAFHIWIFTTQADYSLKSYLIENTMIPIQACALSFWIMCYCAITKNEKLFKLFFPIAILGSTLTVLSGSVEFSIDRFRYWHFYGNHIIFFTLAMYLLIVKEFYLREGDYKKSLKMMFIYVVAVLPINIIFGTNYLFVWNSYGSPLEMLGETFWMRIVGIIILVVITLVSFFALEKGMLLLQKKIENKKIK